MNKYQVIEKLEDYIQVLRQLPDDASVITVNLDFCLMSGYILLSSSGGHPTGCKYKDRKDCNGNQLRTANINGVDVQWYIARKED